MVIKTHKYKALSSIFEASGAAFKRISAESGLPDPRFLTDWEGIVGREFASLCFPLKITQNHLEKTATLFIASHDPSFYSRFNYFKQTILERVQKYFGTSSIMEVKLVRI